eukprot:COSAG02_NODE_48884_length_330_cov_1.787879_1_plen_83_part_10
MSMEKPQFIWTSLQATMGWLVDWPTRTDFALLVDKIHMDVLSIRPCVVRAGHMVRVRDSFSGTRMGVVSPRKFCRPPAGAFHR